MSNLVQVQEIMINDLNGNAKAFAQACYEQNSITEILDNLTPIADEDDCKQWGITCEQWVDSLTAALNEKVSEYRDVS